MKSYIPSLNGLRALSIIMVILYHLDGNELFDHEGVVHSFARFLFHGPLGVSIFFAISGFLITTLLIREEIEKGSISLKAFYTRRMIRIFPAYYFYLFVILLLTLDGYLRPTLIDWLSSVTYTKQFFMGHTVFETSHLWSLSVEEVFYLLWPLLFIYARPYRLQVILIGMLASCIFRLFAWQYDTSVMDRNILDSGDALLVGCCFALYKEQILVWMYKWQQLCWLIIPAILLSVIGYKYLYHLQDAGALPGKHLLKAFALPLGYAFFGQVGTVTNLLIGLLILWSITFETIWFKFLNLPVMNYIGKLSYSLYLWQQLFTCDRIWLHSLPVPLLFVLIGIAAMLSYYAIEQPSLKLKARFSASPAYKQAVPKAF